MVTERAEQPDGPSDSYISGVCAGFMECAWWADAPVNEEGTARLYEDSDDGTRFHWSDSARERVREVCTDFTASNWKDLHDETGYPMDAEQCGHDLWLTAGHHGTGFWDRGLGERGERLTANAHPYEGFYLWVDESAGTIELDG